MLLGAHRATVGGRHHALLTGAEIGCQAVQLFTTSPRQWKPQPLTDDDLAAWQAARASSGIEHVVAHDSYLINLSAVDETIRDRSIVAFTEELLRCQALGIPHLVTHPGAHVGQGEDVGIARFVTALRGIYDAHPELEVTTLLETTAGQGTCLGARFEELATMLDALALGERAAVCVDTCHIFAAGYDVRTDEGYEATIRELDSVIGLERVKVLHLNDSKTPLGSRVDRHEQIGQGELGDTAFANVVSDPRLEGRPMLIETPDLELHGANLDRLRRLRAARLETRLSTDDAD